MLTLNEKIVRQPCKAEEYSLDGMYIHNHRKKQLPHLPREIAVRVRVKFLQVIWDATITLIRLVSSSPFKLDPRDQSPRIEVLISRFDRQAYTSGKLLSVLTTL